MDYKVTNSIEQIPITEENVRLEIFVLRVKNLTCLIFYFISIFPCKKEKNPGSLTKLRRDSFPNFPR